MLWWSFMKGQHESLLLGKWFVSWSILILVAVSLRCTNPYDPYVYIIVSANRHQQRLAILAFQFMEQKTNIYLQEDVSIQQSIMGLKRIRYTLALH